MLQYQNNWLSTHVLGLCVCIIFILVKFIEACEDGEMKTTQNTQIQDKYAYEITTTTRIAYLRRIDCYSC